MTRKKKSKFAPVVAICAGACFVMALGYTGFIISCEREVYVSFGVEDGKCNTSKCFAEYLEEMNKCRLIGPKHLSADEFRSEDNSENMSDWMFE